MEAISNLLYLLSPPVNHKVYIPRGLLLCPGENSSEPLSATDLSCGHRDGSNVRVAYQGIPGAYSEAAALKAYPKCEPVPCDQFEAAFKTAKSSITFARIHWTDRKQKNFWKELHSAEI